MQPFRPILEKTVKTTNRVLIRPRHFAPLAAAIALSLAGCGGGGGGLPTAASPSAASQTSLSGTAIDAPIANAEITITAGAPLNDPGASTVGTVTADGSGGFTLAVTLPASAQPIFANAVDPANTGVVLTSYLGSSTALAAAGVLTPSNLPDLDISPVTTAALAVFAQVNGGSYASLTPATYATTLQTYRSDILAIAAAIRAVGDNLCTPSPVPTSTTNLAAAIAAGSNLSSGNSMTLSAAASTLGGNCPSVLASLPQQISADPRFGPELDLGDVIDAGIHTVPAGGYMLQGLVAETGMTASSTTSNPVNPANVFTDAAVNIDAAGNVTSVDGNVAGTLVGNLLTLTVTDGSQIYNLRGKVGTIAPALVSGGQGWSVQAGGTNTATGVLTSFQAVLAPAGAQPVWNGVAVPTGASSADGVQCASGLPLRLDAFVVGVGGGSVGECLIPGAGGWTMTAPLALANPFNFDDHSGAVLSALSLGTALTATAWTETASAPFVLSDATASFSLGGNSAAPIPGETYYVMGTDAVVFSGSSGNSLFSMHGNVLNRLGEGPGNSVDAPNSQAQDH